MPNVFFISEQIGQIDPNLMGNYEKPSDEETKLKTAFEKNPNDPQAIYNLARYYHTSAKGDTEILDEATSLFEKYLEMKPDDDLARMYYGSSINQKAGFYAEKKDYVKAVEHVKRGLKILDETLEANPDHPEIRLIRAINNASLPEDFGRGKKAIEDFEYLLGLPDVPDGIKSTAYFEYAEVLRKQKQEEKAKEIEEKLKKEFPDF